MRSQTLLLTTTSTAHVAGQSVVMGAQETVAQHTQGGARFTRRSPQILQTSQQGSSHTLQSCMHVNVRRWLQHSVGPLHVDRLLTSSSMQGRRLQAAQVLSHSQHHIHLPQGMASSAEHQPHPCMRPRGWV